MSLPLMPHWWELSHMASPSCKGGWEMSNWAVMFLATILYLFFLNNFTYFLAVLGLCCFAQAFSSCSEWGATLRCHAWASHYGGFSSCGAQTRSTWAWQSWLPGCRAQAQQLWPTGLAALWHGIFWDLGWNPCSLHWQADSHPLCHLGSPWIPFYDFGRRGEWIWDKGWGSENKWAGRAGSGRLALANVFISKACHKLGHLKQ